MMCGAAEWSRRSICDYVILTRLSTRILRDNVMVPFKFSVVRQALLLLAVLLVAGCGSSEERAQSYYERGMKLLSQQDYVKASIEFKNALQLKKDLVGAWRGLAEIETHNRNWEARSQFYARSWNSIQRTSTRSCRLALTHACRQCAGPSTRLWSTRPSSSTTDMPNALAVKAAILLKLNDSAGAMREAQAALEIDPANTEAMIVLAAERMVRGDAEGRC